MKLHYKLTIIIALVGVFGIAIVSILYSNWNYENVIQQERRSLLLSVVDYAYHIEKDLTDKLSNTKSFGTAPIIEQTLIQSNAFFERMDDKSRKEQIEKLNKKWKKERETNTPFIDAYLNNPLAEFLKKQQDVLPKVYGEIFITNRYGAMIVTTGRLSTLAHSHKYWWKQSFNNGKGKIFFDDRGYDISVDGYVIGIVMPIKKEGEIIGILKSNINILGTLKEVADHHDATAHGSLKIVRSKGMVVYEKDAAPLSTTINCQLLPNLKSFDKGFKITEKDGEKFLTAYAPVMLSVGKENIGFGGKTNMEDSAKSNLGEIWHAVICYSQQEALKTSSKTTQLIIYTGMILISIFVSLSFFLAKWITGPINHLSSVASKISKGKSYLRATIETHDEVGELARSLNSMLDSLEEKEQLLIKQSKSAAMGDMIAAIAHQLKQPINTIGLLVQDITEMYEYGELNENAIKNFETNAMKQVTHMSDTIEQFRNFLSPDKKKTEYNFLNTVNNVISLMEKQLGAHNIEVRKDIQNLTVYGVCGEMEQVLLNLFNNAKDALFEKQKENSRLVGKIFIEAKQQEENIIITVRDNGGGIPEDKIDKIFHPYYTTKGKQGTGIGLYMTRMIIEDSLHGNISVRNDEKGAVFTIELPKAAPKDV